MRRKAFRHKLAKKTKITLISVLSVIIVAGGVFAGGRIKSSLSNNNMTTYIVRAEVYENVIEIAGTVSAAKSQSLLSLNDGTVVGVYVKEGDSVKKGDLIVQLDDTEQVYNLANLDYEISVARQNQTAGKIALMQTQRKSLVQKISDRRIEATFDGIVAELDVDPGDYLEAKDSVGTLVDVSYLTADVEIAETDVSKLKIGQKVNFTFPAYGEPLEGYLVSYPAIGEVTSRGATVVNATVRIDTFPSLILPNFSFTGEIEITEPETKLVVERYAIGMEKGQAFVEVLGRNGSFTKQNVEVEPYGADYVNIKSGLNGGEMLKAQSSASKSGRMRVNTNRPSGNNTNNRSNQNNMPGGMPGGGGGGGGFGGPPGF